jgi:lysophospholipase L1-like esterase
VVGITGAAAWFVLPASLASAAPTTQGLSYVALGDSYAAGMGLEPLGGAAVPGCLQSASNYPHQLADALALELTDVTCSGATTANVTTAPQGTADGTAPVQLAALSASVDIVTISIGGNDLGFGTIASSCIALSAAGPVVGSPATNCREAYVDGADALALRVQEVVRPALAETFAAVAAAAPNAQVFVVGYPAIAPDPANTPGGLGGCFRSAIPNGTQPPFAENSFPFTVVDTAYLHDTQEALDRAIQSEADAAGFTFVPVFDETAEHSACQTDGTAYVNGVSIESMSLRPLSVTLRPGALHPNLNGETFMADRTLPLIMDAFGQEPERTEHASLSPAPWVAAAVVVLVGSVTGVLVWRRRTRT